jgi:hypothetical protein
MTQIPDPQSVVKDNVSLFCSTYQQLQEDLLLIGGVLSLCQLW